jgi:hypothetical protein
MIEEQSFEAWQVEANGQVFDTDFAEITSWIDDGSLLRIDRVRRGNLRWIEAGKVPALLAIFNAKDNGEPLPAPVITTTRLAPTAAPTATTDNCSVPSEADPRFDRSFTGSPVCTIHPDVKAAYSCDTCFSKFCKACPNSYGGKVKICPMCGAMCSSLAELQVSQEHTVGNCPRANESFGIADFVNALAYPFKFKTSLVMGAIMYMLFSIGSSVSSFGGIFMMGSSIACLMMANTLSFGVLANTVENFSQGKVRGNFMPSFDEFSVWDDVIQPFFLSIGVYVSSFGPLIAVFLIAFFFLVGTAGKEMNAAQSDAAQMVVPELPYAAKASRQSEEIKGLLNKQQDTQKQRVSALNDANTSADEKYERATTADPDQADFDRINNMIQEQRKAQLESVVGKTPETKAKEQGELLKQILAYGALFLLLGGICLIWGLFYFPAACAVAGYTGSLGATLNPTVGLDTIRRLGFDYFKILLMTLAVVIMSVLVTGVLNTAFSAFDLPGIGNVPAKAIGSLFGFYFSVVFSCVIGFALYKGADRLKLYR